MNEKISLYLVRHGETIFNVNKRMQGWSDTPLTTDGKLRVQFLGDEVKNIPFSVAFSSDSGRAIETIDILIKSNNIFGIQSYKLTGLRELYFGEYEGERINIVWDKLAIKNECQNIDNFLKMKMMDRMRLIFDENENPTAETVGQLRDRVEKSLKLILAESQEKGYQNVLIVSHGVTIATIFNLIGFELSLEKSLPNASISKIDYFNEKFKIDYIGKVAKGNCAKSTGN